MVKNNERMFHNIFIVFYCEMWKQIIKFDKKILYVFKHIICTTDDALHEIYVSGDIFVVQVFVHK